MTDHQGSALPTFKAALIDALRTAEPLKVRYESPASLQDALGEDGGGESVFWLDTTDASYALNIIHGPDHLQFDETAEPTLVIQCVGRDTDDTQAVVDARAAGLQYEVFKILATDPNVLIGADADMQIVRAIPGNATWTTGLDSQNQRGCRIELGIQLEARITAAP